VKYKKFDMLI